MTIEDQHPDEQLPAYPGWKVSREGRNYVATRDEPVSAYAENWGAVDDVDAGSVGELTLLVLAQTHLLATLDQAAKLDQEDRAAARRRHLDQDRG